MEIKTEIDDLTQAEVYDLYDRYGGYLDARGHRVINAFLERMAFETQPVWSVREEGQDKLYYATLALLAKLRGLDAAAVEPAAPPGPQRRRRSREEAAREAVAERRAARRRWAEIVKGATKKGEE